MLQYVSQAFESISFDKNDWSRYVLPDRLEEIRLGFRSSKNSGTILSVGQTVSTTTNLPENLFYSVLNYLENKVAVCDLPFVITERFYFSFLMTVHYSVNKRKKLFAVKGNDCSKLFAENAIQHITILKERIISQ